jgi:hypothetical protein
MKTTAKFLFMLLILGSVFIMTIAEFLYGFPLPSAFYLICFSLAAALLFINRTKAHSLLTIIYAVLLVTVWLVPWSPRKPFLRKFDSIKPGMSVEEVRLLMKGYVEGTGWPANPFATNKESRMVAIGTGQTFQTGTSQTGEMEIKNSVVFRHTIHDGRYNADFGVVTFRNNRVVSTSFLPD